LEPEPEPEPEPSGFSEVVFMEEWKWWSMSDSMFAGLPGMPPYRKRRELTEKELAYWRYQAGLPRGGTRGRLLLFPRVAED
jgi:hypothetical protein